VDSRGHLVDANPALVASLGYESASALLGRNLSTLYADGQQDERYKHEGDEVNTETRHYAGSINHYDGASEAGHYLRKGKDWLYHGGNVEKSMRADENHAHIKGNGAHVWCQGVPMKSAPFIIKPDPCK